MATAQANGPDSGTVQPQVLYDLKTVEAQFDLKSTALRVMRRDGLPIRRVGRKNFIYGQDLIEHVLAKCPLVGADGTLVATCAGSSTSEKSAHQA